MNSRHRSGTAGFEIFASVLAFLVLTICAGPSFAIDVLNCQSVGVAHPEPHIAKDSVYTHVYSVESDAAPRFTISLAKRELTVDDQMTEEHWRLPMADFMRSSGDIIMHFVEGMNDEDGPFVLTIVFTEATGTYSEALRYLSKAEVIANPKYKAWIDSLGGEAELDPTPHPYEAMWMSWGFCSFVS